MSKSNTIICSARNCYSSLVTHPNKSFFGFPSSMTKCQVWLENCGRTDLDVKQVCKSSYWRLCEDHFEDKWFTDSTKKILKRKLNPVPTVLVNNISSLVPSGSEFQFLDVSCTLTPEDLLCLQLLEKDVLDGSDLDSKEFSVRKQQLPITYHTKPLLKPKECEFTSGTVILSQNPDSEISNLDNSCRFCMNKVSHNYLELFSNNADAKEIRKISTTVLQSKISICDGLPHRVCQECVIDLKTCWKLIEKFQNADKYFRSIPKYSLFTENDDVTEIIVERDCSKDGLSYDYFNNPVLKTSPILPESCAKRISEEPFEFLTELEDDDSLKFKQQQKQIMSQLWRLQYPFPFVDHKHREGQVHNCKVKNELNLSKYVKTSMNTVLKNHNWQERSLNIETASQSPSRFNECKNNIHNELKLYKKIKYVSSEEILNKNVLLTQDVNDISRLESTNHMPNYGIDSLGELAFIIHKCTMCSEEFDSNQSLEQHLNYVHGK